MTGVKQTSLYASHVGAGARMVEFGGWSMPLNYGSQLDEHHAVRRSAGVFDVSHMTIVDVSGADAERYLRYVFANDVGRLQVGEDGQCPALYSCMLREDGGVLDDLIVYRLAESDYRVVVNAATREKDLEWLAGLSGDYSLELRERSDLAMIAVQGPRARELVAGTYEDGEALLALPVFWAYRNDDTLIARTGYTGEDGFEIILPADRAETLWAELQALDVAACGLGARDTLRLEAGLNLYGLDMDETVSPLECGLRWTVNMKTKRDFIGRGALERRLANGVSLQQAGLVLKGKGVLRAGCVVSTAEGEGVVSSGTFSPTLARSIALARIPVGSGSECEVVIRDRVHEARIVTPPFVRNGEIKIEN
jgi:aminomethyltransferase